jgi:membrane protein DedA with SNARE-associated domain
MPAASITGSIVSWIGDYGLYAVFLLMVLDGFFPAASELVMLYAGALAAGAFTGEHVTIFGHEITTHWWAFIAVVAAGALGNTLGGLIGWAIGAYGGRPFLERRGRWFHVTAEKLHRAERWFDRFGDIAVFLGRLTPILRSFISYPAGIVRTPLGRFTVLTLLASLIWCLAFAGIGWALGASWTSFHHEFRYADYAILAIVVLSAAYAVARFIRTQHSRA